MAQQTLEEVAQSIFGLVNPILGKSDYRLGYERGLIEGAKWQQERMYSEEEVRKMLSESFNATIEGYNITADEIIEQFKKQ
jgi:hypothetical protein